MKPKCFAIFIVLALLIIVTAVSAGTLRYRVVATEEYSYQSQLTEFFIIESLEDNVLYDTALIRIDGDYMKYYGDIIDGVPVFEDEPIIVEKVYNISPGDSWTSNLEDLNTYEVADQIVQKTVPAGTFSAMEINLYDANDHNVYIGKKWLAENIGYLGFEGSYLGVTAYQRLYNYTKNGGDGYWPMAVGNVLSYTTGESMETKDATYATITVDGYSSDWEGIEPVVNDPEGDDPSAYDGVDIKDLYIAYDDENLYMMFSFWDGAPSIVWGESRVDAYQVYVMPDDDDNVEIGYISYYEPGFWFLSAVDFAFDGTMCAVGDMMECSIPLANLGNPTSLYRYSLSVGDMDENYDKSNMVGINLTANDMARNNTGNIPEKFNLLQNFPNPFNSSTTIEFSLPQPEFVSIDIYNILGQKIESLISKKYAAGNWSVNWDRTDIASGIYFYKIIAGDNAAVRKMILLK